MVTTISRFDYAGMYGPTTGDKIRLADTEIIIEVERDFTTYGEEVKFGGGKVIRDGMGQSQSTRAQGGVDFSKYMYIPCVHVVVYRFAKNVNMRKITQNKFEDAK